MGAAGVDRWLYPTDRGLYCEPGSFFIDPARAVDRAVITHGHGDHARPGHAAVLATRETIEIMKVRYGAECARALRAASAGRRASTSTASACVSYRPATSSARPRSCSTGTASAPSSPATTSARPIRPARRSSSCRAISSSPRRPSALPVFRHEPAETEVATAARLAWPPIPSARICSASTASANASASSRSLRQAGYDAPIYLHGALVELCELYEASRYRSRRAAAGRRPTNRERSRAPWCCVRPLPSTTAGRGASPIPLPAFASGWMRVRAAPASAASSCRSSSPIIADWPELLDTIDETGAEEVWVTHGREDALVLPARPHGPQGARAGARRLRGRGRLIGAVRRTARPADDDAARNGKLRLLADYFRATPDPDRGFALAALTDGLPLASAHAPRALPSIIEPHVDPVLYRLSRDYVGDTAETVSLLWPDRRDKRASPRLARSGRRAQRIAPRANFAPVLGACSTGSTSKGAGRCSSSSAAPCASASRRGSPRRRSRRHGGREVDEIEEVWHALEPPYADLFAWLEGSGPRPDPGRQADVPAGDAGASDRGGRLGRARSARGRGRMEMGRHPRADRRRRRRRARLLARRR